MSFRLGPDLLAITGEGFASGGSPQVALGAFGLLSVISATDTEIIAELSAGIGGGEYLLTVATGKGKNHSDEYALTIGTGGPPGAEPFIAEITLFAGNFASRRWALCEGRLPPISSNEALFSILGTTYGGDVRTTFALPDLRGRVPMGPGTGPGGTNVDPGQRCWRTGTQSLTGGCSSLP